MAEDALKIRRSAKTRFTPKKNEFFKAIAEKKGTEILKENLTSLPMLGLLLNVSTIFT